MPQYYKPKEASIISLEDEMRRDQSLAFQGILFYFFFSVSCVCVLISRRVLMDELKDLNEMMAFCRVAFGWCVFTILKTCFVLLFPKDYHIYSNLASSYPDYFAFKCFVGFAVLLGEINKMFHLNEYARFFRLCDSIVLWNQTGASFVILIFFLIYKMQKPKNINLSSNELV